MRDAAGVEKLSAKESGECAITPKHSIPKGFCTYPKVFRGRGERAISDAEVPFPPPLRGWTLSACGCCPNPSIPLAAPLSTER